MRFWGEEPGKGSHGVPRGHRLAPACVRPARSPVLLTILRIFSIPVGEKKKFLKLSLNLCGTLARPFARFWIAFLTSAFLGPGGPASSTYMLSLGVLDFAGPLPGRAGAEGAAGAQRPGRTEVAEEADGTGCTEAEGTECGVCSEALWCTENERLGIPETASFAGRAAPTNGVGCARRADGG